MAKGFFKGTEQERGQIFLPWPEVAETISIAEGGVETRELRTVALKSM